MAFLKRHKAKTSPRAIRFELLPGKPPAIVLEPWEQRIVSFGTIYNGPPTDPTRIWGAKRLMVLARTLPLAERFNVRLLGTGLPSFWVAHLGEMQLTLGLSGWTTNDWTRLRLKAAGTARTAGHDFRRIAHECGPDITDATFDVAISELQIATGASSPAVMATLRRLAFAGQVIHDLPHNVYRFRQGDASSSRRSPIWGLRMPNWLARGIYC